jgi:hypothetical protein
MSSKWSMIRIGGGYVSRIEIWYQRVDDDATIFLDAEKRDREEKRLIFLQKQKIYTIKLLM